jgi:ribosome-associated toxin RatA of RatAB toxin-antitoxin module
MKELHGSAKAEVAAEPGRCFALLRDVEGYPDWHPETVRRVEVVQRSADGAATRAQAELHLAYGPLSRTFELLLSVDAESAHEVRLARVPHEASDPEEFEVVWRVEPGSVALALRANLSVPRLLPVAGIGDALARDFVHAAAGRLND